jgi:hypothetical protein
MIIEPVLLILFGGITFVIGGAVALTVSDGALRAREQRLADRQRELQAPRRVAERQLHDVE